MRGTPNSRKVYQDQFMIDLDAIINESKDAREVKRALSVKMVTNGISPAMVSKLLNVSLQYVSKWKVKYETEGAVSLLLGYEGRQHYLTNEQRAAVIDWIRGHKTLTLDILREYITRMYGITYQSKQSYYDLLAAGGMSYNRHDTQQPDTTQLSWQQKPLKHWRKRI